MCKTNCVFIIFLIVLVHFCKSQDTISDHFMNNVPTKAAEDLIAKYKAGRNYEDVHLNITQLITKYGYPLETHTSQTQDGYILTMFRIPSKGPPVLLVHGLGGSADDYIVAGPESGIAYLLSQDGYDVWLGNVRGNKHSRQHIRLSPDSEKHKFWNFSWDEIGRYDLPAMIDYVLKTTNCSKLFYVGHSQGTTTFFVMCSMRPDYNNKIALMVALAPVAFMSNMKCPPIRYALPFFSLIDSVKEADHWEITPDCEIINNAKNLFCKYGDLGELLCTNMVFMSSGFNYAQINASNLHIVLAHFPSGASIKQFEHYGQEILSGKFRRFDYGEEKNLKVYGKKHPPDYPLDKVTAPIALFYSRGDYLVDELDVVKLKKKLKNVVDSYLVPDENWTHLDYIVGLDVKKVIYSRMSRLFKTVTRIL